MSESVAARDERSATVLPGHTSDPGFDPLMKTSENRRQHAHLSGRAESSQEGSRELMGR